MASNIGPFEFKVSGMLTFVFVKGSAVPTDEVLQACIKMAARVKPWCDWHGSAFVQFEPQPARHCQFELADHPAVTMRLAHPYGLIESRLSAFHLYVRGVGWHVRESGALYGLLGTASRVEASSTTIATAMQLDGTWSNAVMAGGSADELVQWLHEPVSHGPNRVTEIRSSEK